MESEPDEDTVVRPPTPIVADPADVDADTIIRERMPFADVPVEALVALRPEPPVPASTPVELPAALPSAYGFRVGENPPIGLDAPALLGRHPRLPRIVSGRAPHLVRVPSPSREVSGTHVELSQQGAVVVVTDLRSTNGTVVTAPGRDPVKLRQGESVVVGPGTVIDIGDGNRVEILALQRPEQSERRPS
jgi:hypothetical protein